MIEKSTFDCRVKIRALERHILEKELWGKLCESPVTAIRAGDTDSNKKTDPDPTWLPLIVTPPFPSYPSAHASAGGAAREVLEDSYGKSGLSITLTSPTAPGVVLNYTSWEQITDDIDDARVYGGIHYRFDQTAGARQGRRVASYILQQYLR